MASTHTIMRRTWMLALVLAINACAAPTAPNTAERTTSTVVGASPAAASDMVVYLQPGYAPQLQPIDPVTLQAASNRAPFVLSGVGQYQQTEFFVSANGSTVVAFVGERVRVLDMQSGAQRAEWRRPENEMVRSISPDGTRLAAGQLRPGERGQGWAVLGVDDGRVLASARSQYPLLDWNAHRVYSLAGSGDPLEQIAPQPAVLLVHDLQTGNQIARLTLDGVLTGREQTPFGPSMALSLDGKQLVLLHGDADKLTLVDTQQMQVISTRDLTGSKDPLQVGKVIRGWDLQFAPNGMLYAAGSEQPLRSEASQPSVRYLGVRRINIAQAKVEAEVLVGEDWSWMRVAPDGSAIYFYGSRPGPVPSATQAGPPPNPMLLRRLDPQTLSVTAERPFEGFYQSSVVMKLR